ncbi:MFS transporter [Herminiimonas sp.]|uniref:MFS transporter n=1 Tax=Herminiimonas sp. TaxID=1926289 RepID=UPI00271BBDC8|nr:MFS transporter [Herminiimonas sp.]MDO8304635.1 MFS transporter [Herminiimonas sp.]
MNPSYRWALASVSLSMLLASLGTSIANVGLPAMATAFDASFAEVQSIVLVYLMVITVTVVGVGRLADLTGRRRLLLIGIGLFTVASGLCAIAPTLRMLVALRAVQGLGAAIMMALSMAALPKARIGSAMGLLGTMSAAGTALGPALGGMLIAEFGWPSIFLISIPIGIAALLLAYCFLPADSVRSKPASSAPPKIPRAGLAMNVLVTAVVMATLVIGPFYLAGELALDAAAIGLVMSCGPIVSVLTGVPAGRLVDRVGTHQVTIAGLIGMACGAAGLAMTSASLGVAGYIAPLVILTAGYALFQAANNTAVMSAVADEQRGAASGILTLSRNLGLISGTCVMGLVFTVGGMHLAFAFAALLILAAMAIAQGRGHSFSNRVD